MSALEELIETLASETTASYARRSAILALGRLGDKRAAEPLISALQDEDIYVRRESAKVLGELGSLAAVVPLIEALEDSEEYVRRNAITALGLLGDARAIEPLKQVSEDRSFLIRNEAERSLRKIEEALKESASAEETDVEEIPPAQEDTAAEESEIAIPPVEEAAPPEGGESLRKITEAEKQKLKEKLHEASAQRTDRIPEEVEIVSHATFFRNFCKKMRSEFFILLSEIRASTRAIGKCPVCGAKMKKSIGVRTSTFRGPHHPKYCPKCGYGGYS